MDHDASQPAFALRRQIYNFLGDYRILTHRLGLDYSWREGGRELPVEDV